MKSRLTLSLAACGLAFVAAASQALAFVPTEVPDNGAGTADMPLQAPYVNTGDPMFIIDGLPPGTTVVIDGTVEPPNPPSSFTEIGAYAAGTTSSSTAMALDMSLSGTGSLSGYNRALTIPLGLWEHTNNPRTPFAPVQSFDTTLTKLQGQLPPGDPDFDLLRITAGTDFGLPSPGHTTLAQSGPNWAVDSFFDITYRIDFVGHPGGPFAGLSGSTTGTSRYYVVPEPSFASVASLFVGGALLLRRRRRRTR